MYQRVITLLWLALFAMVLPAHAVAYLSQTESDIGARLDPCSSQFAPLSKNDAQALFDASRKAQDSSSSPVSQSEGTIDVVAIINLNRWGMSGRIADESDSNQAESNLADLNPSSPYKPYCHPLPANEYWVDDALTSSHRISGWKESNALYVALNSQFA